MLDIPLRMYIFEFVSIYSIYYLKIFTYINLTIINEKINIIEVKNLFLKWGLGIGDWGLGIGDWGLGPIPNPQSPIPNPQSPSFIFNFFNYFIKNILDKIENKLIN